MSHRASHIVEEQARATSSAWLAGSAGLRDKNAVGGSTVAPPKSFVRNRNSLAHAASADRDDS
eukprot:12956047-Alexandrium_andersonii.AAC.1